MLIFYLAVILITVISLSLFPEQIVINKGSLTPIILSVISLFQVLTFKDAENGEYDSNNYSLIDIDMDAYKKSLKYHKICKIASVPLMLYFTVFFGTVIKAVCSVAIYILAHFPPKLLVKFEGKDS